MLAPKEGLYGGVNIYRQSPYNTQIALKQYTKIAHQSCRFCLLLFDVLIERKIPEQRKAL